MRSIEIYKNIKSIKIYNKIDIDINKITIDTRKVELNDCYVGINGEHNNGNLLYMDAFSKGASIAILDDFEINHDIDEYLKNNNKSIILVKDSIFSLGELAKYKRGCFHFPVIAVTGSAGKTSTKDMIYSVLNTCYKPHKTIGNQNNHIGLPLSLLSLSDKNDVLVLEMGMNHLKEISYLTNIAKPNIAVITNVGTAHIGNLGSRDNILKAKLEILEGLNKDGYLIINNDNDLLHDWYLKNKNKYNILTIGIDNESDFLATNISEGNNESEFVCKGNLYHVPVGGKHFVYNALVSIAVASLFNIDYEFIKKGIMDFELSSNRMSIIKNNDITIIDDSYNANYDSMNYAIKYLSTLPGRRIAILGTMKELGDYSEKLHKAIGKVLSDEKIDILITVGDEAKYINDEAESNGFNKDNSYHFDNNEDAINLINKIKEAKDNILVKASNSMNFKAIVEKIK